MPSLFSEPVVKLYLCVLFAPVAVPVMLLLGLCYLMAMSVVVLLGWIKPKNDGPKGPGTTIVQTVPVDAWGQHRESQIRFSCGS